MSTIILAESFEIFSLKSDWTFNQFLEDSGYAPSGVTSAAPDRTGRAIAADLSNGGVTMTVTSLEPIVAFGFAARTDTDVRVLSINEELTLDIGAELFLNGFSAPSQLPLAQWLYYELVVDKARREVDVRINGQYQASYPMPNGLRFVTKYEVAFLPAANLLIDDVYVSNGGPVGPISARAFGTDAELPEVLTGAGQRAGGQLFEPGPLPEDVALVKVQVCTTASDLDGRETAVYAGDAEVSLPASTSACFVSALFPRSGGGSSWTDAIIQSTEFGVVVTR